MVNRAIQFQKGLSMLELQRYSGTEELREAGLEKSCWLAGFN